MTVPFEGGCLCGALRYRGLAPPVHAFYCHCRHCQQETGGPFAAELYLPSGTLEWSGSLASHAVAGDSGRPVIRQRCGACGSPLFTLFNSEPNFLCVKIGSLDDASWVVPEFHLYVASKAPWYTIRDGLPQRSGDLD